ncbi:MAG: prolyl oligopeptidase family serine peptidase, partial [Candidatus Rokuibacteriota bacterium]
CVGVLGHGCAGVPATSTTRGTGLGPPATRIEAVREVVHGVEVIDPYRWLEGHDREVGRWVDRQNQYTSSTLGGLAQRPAIRTRLEELYQIDSVGIPLVRGARYFFTKRRPADDLSILYVRDGRQGAQRMLVNPNTLSAGKTTVLRGFKPSRDGTMLTYGLSEAGNNAVSLHTVEVDTGRRLDDAVPADVYAGAFVEWESDGTGFWYIRSPVDTPRGEEHYGKNVYFHRLGTDWRHDAPVCCENTAKDDRPEVTLSPDGRWLLATVYRSTGEKRTQDVYVQDRRRGVGTFVPVMPGVKAQFTATAHRDMLYLLTNHGAPRWKIVAARLDDVARGVASWRTIVPEGEHRITGVKVMADRLFVVTIEDIAAALRVFTLEGRRVADVKLPALGSIAALSGEAEGRELFFAFTSFFLPYSVYRYDLATDAHAGFEGAASVDRDDFAVERAWATSRDGTRIPMFVIHKKGVARTGANPTVLYGYGGFGGSLTPWFNKGAVMFLERGGVYALASIRGGGEFGDAWHDAGRRENKQNTFDDFIAAAEWLIAREYTSPRRLAISGWSHGGLLVAAVSTQRPELFKAVVMGAPRLDMVRYHKLLGGRYRISEYGDPDDPEHFKYLFAYSPYHNVKKGVRYPASLILTADGDDRVPASDAYKMAARLQAPGESEAPVLLRVERNAGHSGATPQSRHLQLSTDIWTFVFWQLGMLE